MSYHNEFGEITTHLLGAEPGNRGRLKQRRAHANDVHNSVSHREVEFFDGIRCKFYGVIECDHHTRPGEKLCTGENGLGNMSSNGPSYSLGCGVSDSSTPRFIIVIRASRHGQCQ